MLLLPGQSPPPHPSPQAGTFCGISAHERPATGPSRLPQALRTIPRHFEPSPPRTRRRAARKRASQRLARTRSRYAGRKPPSTRLPRSTTRHAAKSAAKSPQTTNSRPSALSPQHRRRAKKRGEIIPPSCHRFQCVEINDCPDRTIRLCRAAHAQSRADRTAAGPPFFRRDPQR